MQCSTALPNRLRPEPTSPAALAAAAADSPLANWLLPGGLQDDADSEIVVVVSASPGSGWGAGACAPVRPSRF